MSSLWWCLLGVAIGVILMIPVMRLMLRRAERRARQAERRARDAERLAELGSMTGGLAHEIKNPLSTIGLNAQLLAEAISESALAQEQKDRLVRRLDTLARETERLRGILTDFLQFAGRIKLDPQPCDLNRVVEELSDFFHPQATKAGVVLRTNVSANPVIASVDEALLKQAILNLMLNATQAMTASASAGGGRSELILRIEGDEHQARVHVIDTGPGIEPTKVAEIFRPYVSGRPGGTGLGLPTAKRIAQEHGGDLTVHSERGRGSDFTIHLPLALQREEKGG